MKKSTKQRIDNLRERINAYRQERNLSITELAERWGLPFSTVQGWVSGDHGPRGAAALLVEQKLAR